MGSSEEHVLDDDIESLEVVLWTWDGAGRGPLHDDRWEIDCEVRMIGGVGYKRLSGRFEETGEL